MSTSHGAMDPSQVSLDIEKAELQASHQLSRTQTAPDSESPDSTASSASSFISRQQTAPDPDYDPTHPTVLERQQTAVSVYQNTVAAELGKFTSRSAEWPQFGGGKGYPPPLPHREQYVVDFTGPDDPLHGQNWPLKKKMITAAVLGYTTLVSAWGSSIFSSATQSVAIFFGISVEASILGMSLYVLGFAFGPLIWAPLSELRGRRLPLIIGCFGFSIFQIAVAVAKDTQTVMISRFFGGVFGACPLAVVAAVFADIFGPATRGVAIAIFSMMVFSGPLLAPIAGGFIVQSYLGWRWTEYITAIMGFLALTLNLLFLEETYPPVILVAKASHLRRITKNWGIHAKQEEIEIDFKELVKKNFGRPLKLLFSEPIIFLISLYTSFVYGILYLLLEGYPIVFQEIRGWNGGVGALPFIGLVLGMISGGILVICFQPWANRRAAANGGIPRPEDRLPPVIIGSFFFPAGIFWFAWAGNAGTSVHWIVPTLAGLPLGFGLITVFLQTINYLVDSYLMFAASAIAANTFLRSTFGCVFPLFGRQMFHNLGVGWGASLLGFLGVAMIPIPICFFLYGEKIRSKSKWAPTNLHKAKTPEAEKGKETV